MNTRRHAGFIVVHRNALCPLRAALWVSDSTKRIANCSLLALMCPPKSQRTGHLNPEKVPVIARK
jgi:hypothetical protein